MFNILGLGKIFMSESYNEQKGGNKMKKQKPNNQRSNAKNPNNTECKKAMDNRSVQLNKNKGKKK